MDVVKQDGNEGDFPSDALMSYWADPKVEVKMEDKSQVWPSIKSEGNEIAREKEKSVDKDVLASGLKQGKKKQIAINVVANSDVSTKQDQKKKNALGQISLNRNSEISQKHKLLKSLENAKVSNTVQNLCKYQCPKCYKIYKTCNSISLHFRNTKHVLWLHKISNTSDYLIQIAAFQCNLCNRKILCNIKSIFNHFKNIHNILSIKEYCAKNNIEYNSKQDKFKEDFNLFYTNHPKKQHISKNIENLCIYNCSQCDYVSRMWKNMSQHFTSTGHGPFQTPTQCVTEVNFYKCQLCDKVMLCDLSFISHHVRKHKLTMTQYKRKHQSPQDILKTQFRHKLQWFIKDIPVFKGKSICILKPQSLQSCQTTKDTGNMSFFKCPVCSRSNMSFSCLVAHSVDRHEVKHFQLKKEYITEARYHKCHICAKIVICDNRILSSHLMSHKIKLSEYNSKFVVKNGNRVFPTYQEFKSNRDVFDSFESVQPQKASQPSDNGLITPDMLSSESEDSDEDVPGKDD